MENSNKLLLTVSKRRRHATAREATQGSAEGQVHQEAGREELWVMAFNVVSWGRNR